MIGYTAWVLVGLLLAFAAMRWQPRALMLAAGERAVLRFAAIGGAVLGAYGLQLPADLWGWNAPLPAGFGGDALPLGGRTVLGGLLGGWLGVEVGKRLAGVRQPTGGDFALPLALALGCGRLGCLCAGCCAGRVCDAAWYATRDADGVPRLPVQALEAGFHFVAAIALAALAVRGRLPTQRLAIYLTAYAVVRFLLEFWRQHPVVALGLSWHQFLALALLALAGGTWLRRARGSAAIAPVAR